MYPPAESSASAKRPSKRCICSASKTASSASRATSCPTSGAPREAASERIHLGEYRQNSRPEARSRPDLLRSPSRHRRRSGRGLNVHAFNQRTVAEILDKIRMLGAMVGAGERAEQLVSDLEAAFDTACKRAERLSKRPRVFFEEWDDPLISGIGWVSELVEIAGGIDIFADRRDQSAAKNRIVTPAEVIAREPDLIIGSWCGKKFRPERVAARNGFDRIPAVEHDDLYEIKSSLILQPDPAALTDGLAELQRIIERWATRP
jgi:Periplasmic binding protein